MLVEAFMTTIKTVELQKLCFVSLVKVTTCEKVYKCLAVKQQQQKKQRLMNNLCCSQDIK